MAEHELVDAQTERAAAGADFAATEGELVDRAYLPAVNDPGASLDHAISGDGAPEERIKKLFARMRTSRKALITIITRCAKQPQTIEDLVDVEAGDFSIYAPATLCAHLIKAGALEEMHEEAEPKRVVIDGVEYLEPAEDGQAVVRYKATPAGIASVEAMSGEGVLSSFERRLEDEPQYRDVYERVLTICAEDGGATAKRLSDEIDADPALQEPRMYVSYFYDALDELGLVEWDDAWKTTPEGLKALERMSA